MITIGLGDGTTHSLPISEELIQAIPEGQHQEVIGPFIDHAIQQIQSGISKEEALEELLRDILYLEDKYL